MDGHEESLCWPYRGDLYYLQTTIARPRITHRMWRMTTKKVAICMNEYAGMWSTWWWLLSIDDNLCRFTSWSSFIWWLVVDEIISPQFRYSTNTRVFDWIYSVWWRWWPEYEYSTSLKANRRTGGSLGTDDEDFGHDRPWPICAPSHRGRGMLPQLKMMMIGKK